MSAFRTQCFQTPSQEVSQQKKVKQDARCHQKDDLGPDPAQVVHDIKAGLMGLSASKFSDVVLKTPDNQSVYVCRALLAVRSSFFAKLFFSDFAERNEADIVISVHSRPLKHVVEFAYTGDSTLVRSIASSFPDKVSKLSDNSSFRPSSVGSTTEKLSRAGTARFAEAPQPRPVNPTAREIHRTAVTDLVDLAAAADYCAIAPLKKWSLKTLDTLIRCNMKTACTALEALGTRTWEDEGDMMSRQTLMQFITSHPEECLLVPDCQLNPAHVNFNIGDCTGALELSAKSMNELLETKSLKEGQQKRSQGSLYVEYLFQVIYFWGSNGLLPMKEGLTDPQSKKSRSGLWYAVTNKSTEKLTMDAEGIADRTKVIKEEQDGPRWSSAIAMMKMLDLTKMRSSFLRDYVEGSGLFSNENIVSAYRYHATHSEDFLSKNGYVMNSSGKLEKNDNPFGIVPV